MRLVLIGWGAIAQRVAGLLPGGVTLVGVALREGSASELPPGLARITTPAALAALGPDLVIEAAGRAAVLPWGLAALQGGADFAPASTSALTDPAVHEALLGAAIAARRQLILAPGALGGIDALAAAALLPLSKVRHEIVKPPRAWSGTAAEGLCDLEGLSASVTFWRGPAAEAASRFPQNANVAAISALAGLGLAQTEVALIADPGVQRNIHRIRAEGAFGTLSIELQNLPMASNPKTSELTALSLVRLLANRVNPMVI